MRRLVAVAMALTVALLPGCKRPKPSTSPPRGEPAGAVVTTVLVADDAALAQAVARLEGDWAEVTGGKLAVKPLTLAELLEADQAAGDVVIFPTAALGELAGRSALTPLPDEVRDAAPLAWADVFDSVQLNDVRWGERTYALPLGSPVLLLFYRTDVFEQLSLKPPKTWDEYEQLLPLLADSKVNPKFEANSTPAWAATLEPCGEDWAGRLWVARAAAYLRHRDSLSPLIDLSTTQLRAASPPMIEALRQLRAATRAVDGLPPPKERTPAVCLREFLAGRSAMAVTWFIPLDGKILEASVAKIPFAVAELPGAERVFEQGRKRWETRRPEESPRVTTTGLDGRLVGVRRGAVHPTTAWKLATWLSGPGNGERVQVVSEHQGPFRRAQLKNLVPWAGRTLDASGLARYGAVETAALSTDETLIAPRLLHYRELLAALDAAAVSACTTDAPLGELAQQAEAAWAAAVPESEREQVLKSLRASIGQAE